MSELVVKNLIDIIKNVKFNRKFDEYLDSEISSIYSIVTTEILESKLEQSKYLKKIIDDKLSSLDIKDEQSFYVGKLFGLSTLIAQVKHTLDFEDLALSLDDTEINALLYLYNRREVVWEDNDDEVLAQTSIVSSKSALNVLEERDLLINHKFSDKNFCTLSPKGDDLVKVLQKRNKLNLRLGEIGLFETDSALYVNVPSSPEKEEDTFMELFNIDRVASEFEEDEVVSLFNRQ